MRGPRPRCRPAGSGRAGSGRCRREWVPLSISTPPPRDLALGVPAPGHVDARTRTRSRTAARSPSMPGSTSAARLADVGGVAELATPSSAARRRWLAAPIMRSRAAAAIGAAASRTARACPRRAVECDALRACGRRADDHRVGGSLASICSRSATSAKARASADSASGLGRRARAVSATATSARPAQVGDRRPRRPAAMRAGADDAAADDGAGSSAASDSRPAPAAAAQLVERRSRRAPRCRAR